MNKEATETLKEFVEKTQAAIDAFNETVSRLKEQINLEEEQQETEVRMYRVAIFRGRSHFSGSTVYEQMSGLDAAAMGAPIAEFHDYLRAAQYLEACEEHAKRANAKLYPGAGYPYLAVLTTFTEKASKSQSQPGKPTA